ncbi:TIGR03668 family PPOX class F420-dependent oxidoreductase [Egibacter rhizosphaerae]|uniref:TIGR03668 family PPOX class F420-dependent oxidoreductase n=1 Tax=Egibacter rhizosphaerae TaxID=1670831 RepID=A0A411YB61_9ACTN|nr:TIGR03668 family PPOX class F420-dependent oxidoreductase [Egibacter rhizosphaerae]QBI18407.1 TIGR03668 family PPOX class F420-dependent oxidoreductase [Egibacter rhizosphaerae]
MDERDARARFADSRIARLATVRPDGAPHVVPVVFAVDGDAVYTAVDRKPKRHQRLQRLANLWHEPRCSLLVDHYGEDWSDLWWVRADGHAAIVDEPQPEHDGLQHLVGKYPHYRDAPPNGPLIVVDITRWASWAAGG